jgi:hypothetical protein
MLSMPRASHISVLVYAAALIAFLAEWPGSTARAQHAVSLSVDRVRSKAQLDPGIEKQWGSWEKDYKRSVVLEIDVRNMLNQPDAVIVEWLFVAKTEGSNLKWAYDRGKREFTLAPLGNETLYARSRTLDEAVVEQIRFDERLAEGNDRMGYIVLAYGDDELLTVAASSRTLERIAKDEVQLKALKEAAH